MLIVSNVRVEGITPVEDDEVLLVDEELLVEDCDDELDDEVDEELDDEEVKGKEAVDTEDDELVEVEEVVCEDVVLIVDFTLDIAKYAAPAAINTITTMTAMISATLASPVFERFKLN